MDVTTFQTSLNNSTPSSIFKKFDQTLMSDEDLLIFTSIVDTWLSFLIGFLGIITNTITVTVFTRMGFKDTVNITMTTIACWDILRLLCGTFHRCYSPIFLVSESLGKTWQNITSVYLLYLHVIASNVAYVVGSYVALERCLCVTFPLKVKMMVTPLVTFKACTALSLVVFISLFPSLLFLEIRWVSDVHYDQPIAVYVYSNFYKVEGRFYASFYQYISLFYPMASFIIMVISTAVISFQLRKYSRFRNNAAVNNFQSQKGRSILTSRDSQVVKMLLLIISTYIIVLIPRVAFYLAQFFEPEFFILKYYNNVFFLVVYSVFFLDLVNTSAGIVIFYCMSSKFRTQLELLLQNSISAYARNKLDDMELQKSISMP